MDISETGQLGRLAKGLGDVVDTSVTDEGGEVFARAFHVRRRGQPDLVVAGSTTSGVVVGLLTDGDGALVGMAAARVLAHVRGDELRAGRVVSIPAGAPGARSVRGSTGSFAIVPSSAGDLPRSIDVLAVHAPPPVSEWEKATLDEVRGAVPDLVSRFKKPKARGSAGPKKKAPAGKRTVVRRRS